MLLRRAANWAKEHLKVETFESEVAKGYSAVYSFYHYADYYLGASQAFAPDIAQAWAQRISEALVVLAQDAEEVQAGDLLLWLMRYPASLKALLPQSEVDRHLDALQAGQQENGAWLDRHNLLVWQPVQTIWALKTLRDSGRL